MFINKENFNPVLIENQKMLQRFRKRYITALRYENEERHPIYYLDKSMIIKKKEIQTKAQEQKKQFVIRHKRAMTNQTIQIKEQSLLMRFLTQYNPDKVVFVKEHEQGQKDLKDLEQQHRSNQLKKNKKKAFNVNSLMAFKIIQMSVNNYFNMNDFSIQCYRKHPISDQHYHLVIKDAQMTLAAVQKYLNPTKQPNHINTPKYILQLNWKLKISWQLDQQLDLLAFGFTYKNKFKWFHSDKNHLEQLKQKLSTYVAFAQVSDFYEAKSQIGSGSSSQVFEIENRKTRVIYASKCMLKSYLEKEEDGLEGLYHELQILKNLNQENVLKFFEFYEGDHSYYIITDFAKGINVGQHIRNITHPIHLRLTQRIIQESLKAILYLHENKLIHRDIKPENIIFSDERDNFQLKIVDYGLATYTDVQSYRFPKCGTPGYAAPEIVNLKDLKYKYSNACDIFSLGSVFWKLLVRKDLFLGRTQEEILIQNKLCRINFSILQLLNVPQVAQDLIEKMLELDPSQRITAEEALNHQFFCETINTRIRSHSQRRLMFKNSKQNLVPQYQTQQFNDEDFYAEYFDQELPAKQTVPVMDNVKGGQIESFRSIHLTAAKKNL